MSRLVEVSFQIDEATLATALEQLNILSSYLKETRMADVVEEFLDAVENALIIEVEEGCEE